MYQASALGFGLDAEEKSQLAGAVRKLNTFLLSSNLESYIPTKSSWLQLVRQVKRKIWSVVL
jgi:hypothetical protein